MLESGIDIVCEGCGNPKCYCTCNNQKENFFIENLYIIYPIIVASLIIFA